MRQEDVDAAGGPSTATLRLIERQGAKRYRQSTYKQLDTALRWQPGSAWNVLTKGAEPVPLEQEQKRGGAIDTSGLTEEERKAIQNMVNAMREGRKNPA